MVDIIGPVEQEARDNGKYAFLHRFAKCKEKQLASLYTNAVIRKNSLGGGARDSIEGLLRRVYTERKTFIAFILHFIMTMVVWSHFFYIKFTQMKDKLDAIPKDPSEINRYWLKRMIPPLEFGAMHAILLQMALLPVTMSRVTLSYAQKSPLLRSILPFNRVVNMHIHLGYVMCGFVFLATIVFFTFFGIMCQDQKDEKEPLDLAGERHWCLKFRSEIMGTGYGILACLLFVFFTSYYRHSIRYEVFYAVHHLVIAMFAITVAHTLDAIHMRPDNGRERSQTFKWFSLSLWLYFSDRLYAYFFSTYVLNCDLSASTAHRSSGSGDDDGGDCINGGDPKDQASLGVRSVLLRVPRPVGFLFEPGQWAYLHVPDIDGHWHPFSIASDPVGSDLEFLVEVKGPGSWSEALWLLVHDAAEGSEDDEVEGIHSLRGNFKGLLRQRMARIHVQGPFGCALSLHAGTYNKVLAVGGGSGIVPMLSMLKRNTKNLCQLDPAGFYRTQRMRRRAGTGLAADFDNQRFVFELLLPFVTWLAPVGDFLVAVGGDLGLGWLCTWYNPLKSLANDAVQEQRRSLAVVNTAPPHPDSPSAKGGSQVLKAFYSSNGSGKSSGSGRSSRVAQSSLSLHRNDDDTKKAAKESRARLRRMAARAIVSWYRVLMVSRALRDSGTSAPTTPSKRRPATIKRIARHLRKLRVGLLMRIIYIMLPCWGLVCLGVTWSFYTHTFFEKELVEWMPRFTEISTIVGVAGFCLFVLSERINSFIVFVDISIGLSGIASCVWWSIYDRFGDFTEVEMAAYMGFGFYMFLRFWHDVVNDEGIELVADVNAMSGGAIVPESFDLVWTSRSAAQVSALLPTLNRECERVHKHWGSHSIHSQLKPAQSRALILDIQRVQVHVTDPDPRAVEALARDVLPKCPHVQVVFARANLSDWLSTHLHRLALGDAMLGSRVTTTLLAFCGSSTLGAHLDGIREEQIWSMAMMGTSNHKVVFEQENYGHSPTATKPASLRPSAPTTAIVTPVPVAPVDKEVSVVP